MDCNQVDFFLVVEFHRGASAFVGDSLSRLQTYCGTSDQMSDQSGSIDGRWPHQPLHGQGWYAIYISHKFGQESLDLQSMREQVSNPSRPFPDPNVPVLFGPVMANLNIAFCWNKLMQIRLFMSFDTTVKMSRLSKYFMYFRTALLQVQASRHVCSFRFSIPLKGGAMAMAFGLQQMPWQEASQCYHRLSTEN